mgnify:CR=1 FL=1
MEINLIENLTQHGMEFKPTDKDTMKKIFDKKT